MSHIQIDNLFKTYHRGNVDIPVLKGLSISVRPGEYVALMGASGSGKTTLMNIVGFLDRQSSGDYSIDGTEVTGLSSDRRARLRNESVGFVFQSFNLLPRTTALDNVMMPLAYAAEPVTKSEARKRAAELLDRVGLGDRMDHVPAQLSGGQQQRVAIARALINRPTVLLADEPTGNLDTTSSKEILEMFGQLNEEDGITIIMVTHEQEVAEKARRIVRMADGLITQDELVRSSNVVEIDRDKTKSEATRSKRRFSIGRGFTRTFPLAVRALNRNILRSVLTALGIIIGVAAIIAITEIGQGAAAGVKDILLKMGAGNLVINPGKQSGNGVSLFSVLTLTAADSDAIAAECPDVLATAPLVGGRAQIVYGNQNWIPQYMYGTTPDFLAVRDWENMSEGTAFDEQHVRGARAVCLIGKTVARKLFKNESPVGKDVRISQVPFRVLGVLGAKAANVSGQDQDDIVIAPWTTMRYRVNAASVGGAPQMSGSSRPTAYSRARRIYPDFRTNFYPPASPSQQLNTPQPVRVSNVDVILVQVSSTEAIPSAMKQITDILRTRHKIPVGEPDDFNVKDLTEFIRANERVTGLLVTLLLCVAAICLMVGGVGIMNIMLVAVTERTREIGLRMAVGASEKAILNQFLVEAVILCLLGACIGIGLGRCVSLAAHEVLALPIESSKAAMLGAAIVSTTIGITFGYYPARKASRMDPIEALRYE